MANERFIEFPPTFQPEAWSVPDSSRGQMDGEYGRMRPNMPPRPSSHAGVRVGAQMHVGKQDMIRGGGPGRWAADSRMGVPDEYVRGQNKFYRSSGSDMQDRGVGYGAQGIPGVQKESMQQHWNQGMPMQQDPREYGTVQNERAQIMQQQAAMANIRRGRTGRARASKKTQWIDRTGKQVEAPSYDMPNQPSRVQGPPHGMAPPAKKYGMGGHLMVQQNAPLQSRQGMRGMIDEAPYEPSMTNEGHAMGGSMSNMGIGMASGSFSRGPTGPPQGPAPQMEQEPISDRQYMWGPQPGDEYMPVVNVAPPQGMPPPPRGGQMMKESKQGREYEDMIQPPPPNWYPAGQEPQGDMRGEWQEGSYYQDNPKPPQSHRKIEEVRLKVQNDRLQSMCEHFLAWYSHNQPSNTIIVEEIALILQADPQRMVDIMEILSSLGIVSSANSQGSYDWQGLQGLQRTMFQLIQTHKKKVEAKRKKFEMPTAASLLKLYQEEEAEFKRKVEAASAGEPPPESERSADAKENGRSMKVESGEADAEEEPRALCRTAGQMARSVLNFFVTGDSNSVPLNRVLQLFDAQNLQNSLPHLSRIRDALDVLGALELVEVFDTGNREEQEDLRLVWVGSDILRINEGETNQLTNAAFAFEEDDSMRPPQPKLDPSGNRQLSPRGSGQSDSTSVKRMPRYLKKSLAAMRRRRAWSYHHGRVGIRSCRCVKSRCENRYCDCFASGSACINCSCTNCGNTQKPTKRRRLVARGCRCMKSHCSKGHCDCFAAGKGCTERCQCINCENPLGSQEFAGLLPKPSRNTTQESTRSSRKGRKRGSRSKRQKAMQAAVMDAVRSLKEVNGSSGSGHSSSSKRLGKRWKTSGHSLIGKEYLRIVDGVAESGIVQSWASGRENSRHSRPMFMIRFNDGEIEECDEHQTRRGVREFSFKPGKRVKVLHNGKWVLGTLRKVSRTTNVLRPYGVKLHGIKGRGRDSRLVWAPRSKLRHVDDEEHVSTFSSAEELGSDDTDSETPTESALAGDTKKDKKSAKLEVGVEDEEEDSASTSAQELVDHCYVPGEMVQWKFGSHWVKAVVKKRVTPKDSKSKRETYSIEVKEKVAVDKLPDSFLPSVDERYLRPISDGDDSKRAEFPIEFKVRAEEDDLILRLGEVGNELLGGYKVKTESKARE
ncbi:hypothetical protein AAMO2058_001343500 [Amorphochlora amoebiformis]